MSQEKMGSSVSFAYQKDSSNNRGNNSDRLIAEDTSNQLNQLSQKNNNSPNAPRLKLSAGAIKATVWDNNGKNSQGEDTSYQTISLERVYQDKSGKWKSTNSFRVNDLPKVSLMMDKIYEELVLKKN